MTELFLNLYLAKSLSSVLFLFKNQLQAISLVSGIILAMF